MLVGIVVQSKVVDVEQVDGKEGYDVGVPVLMGQSRDTGVGVQDHTASRATSLHLELDMQISLVVS